MALFSFSSFFSSSIMEPAKRLKLGQLFEEISTQKAFRNALLQVEIKLREESNDLKQFLIDLSYYIQEKLEALIEQHKGVKLWLAIEVEYAPLENLTKPITGFLRTKALVYRNAVDIEENVQKQIKDIEGKNANFMRAQSGLTMRSIKSVFLCASKHQPLVGRGTKPLPHLLKDSKSIVNVDNKDDRCFGYALLSALHPQEQNCNRARKYDIFFTEHGLDDIDYPVSPDEVPGLEDQLQINVNIFSFFDDEGQGKYPLYVSRRNFQTTIDLLFWEGHYAWIKNFDKFMHSITRHNGRKFICKRCFGHFNEEDLLEQHQYLCAREDFSSQIFTLPPPGTVLKFKNIRYQLPLPFVIYADFECLTEPVTPPAASEAQCSHAYQKHIPCSVGLKLVSRIPELSDIPYQHQTSPDAPNWFLQQLLFLQDQIKIYLFDDQRLIMTNEDRKNFDSAIYCFICGKPFGEGQKVRDHDHYTGKFRGAAHSQCNIQMRKTYKIPVFLHNFRGYDAHLIVLAMANYPKIEIKVIGQGYEKYLTVSWGDHLVFKDSYQFMSCSLEQLSSNLSKSGAAQFKQLRKHFGDECPEKKAQLDLLLRKGVYPYDYMNSWARFGETALPPILEFSSRLRNSKCTPEDYEHAQRVWNAFKCATLGDYHEIYLKTGMKHCAIILYICACEDPQYTYV